MFRYLFSKDTINYDLFWAGSQHLLEGSGSKFTIGAMHRKNVSWNVDSENNPTKVRLGFLFQWKVPIFYSLL